MIEPIIVSFPAIIKARQDSDGRRIIECEASVEKADLEGDIIEQKALLDSADSFIKTGHIDIDHLSEIGSRLGIPNPESYIIGRPTEVKDLGSKRTGVVAEIMRSNDGSIDIIKNRYDSFWKTLQNEPPVAWRASVFGYPADDGVIDCRGTTCDSGATRFHVKALDWKSLAMTRNPICDSIKGTVKIVTAKSFMASFYKDMGFGSGMMESAMPGMGAVPTAMSAAMPPPRNLDDAWGMYHRHMTKDCPHAEGGNSRAGFRNHFQLCCGMPPDLSDVWSHALMMMVHDSRKAKSIGFG